MLDWEKCLLVGFMLTMKRCTRMKLVPFVLCMTGVLVLSLAGCRKEEAKPEIPPSSPQSYMNDTNFLGKVTAKRKDLQAIVRERAPLVKRMEELVRAHGKDLAALQRIPEWNELHAKVVALNAKYEETRKRQLKVVCERINPKRDQGSGIRDQKEKAISK